MKCQHAITALIVDSHTKSSDYLSMQSGIEVLLAETSLSYLPIWAAQCGCPISWFLQVDTPNLFTAKTYEKSPEWTIMGSSSEKFFARHSSGTYAVLCDEAYLLMALAKKDSCKKMGIAFPVIMLQPYINRAEMTKETVMASRRETPYLFYSWLRADLPLCCYRYDSGVPRYGPDDKDGESLPHIVQALLDVKPFEEVFAGRRDQWSGNNSSSGSVNRKPHGKARKGRKSKK